MNKRYDKTDEERHESRRLEQEQAEKQKSRQGGDPRRSDQQQAGQGPHRQEGSWQTDEDRRGGSGENIKPDEERTIDEP